MKRIAVLTSGGDAPGMNAAVRSIVRTGLEHDFEVFGVNRGFQGLIAGDIVSLKARDVSGIIQRGGTFLGSARSTEFMTEAGRQKALGRLSANNIDAVVVIGGNGSQAGTYELARLGVPALGVASTIDNDLYGSDIAIGVDTALNIAVEAIDRLKITASSHKRGLVVEVMGRHCGYLALMAGIAGGAEAIVIPEREVDAETVAAELQRAYQRGKAHAIIVVAEGAKNNADGLMEFFRNNESRLGFELRVTILGYVQRGGHPTVFDRLLATRLGAAATRHLARGEHGMLVGWIGGETAVTPLSEVVSHRKQLDLNLVDLANVLSK